MRIRSILTTSLLTLFATAASANPSGAFVVLVPVNPGVISGAGGARWNTTLWLGNRGTTDVEVACALDVLISPVPCPIMKAQTTFGVETPGVFYSANPHPGFFVAIRSGFTTPVFNLEDLSLNLRSSDSVTAPGSAGTEIPLPSPSQFKPKGVTLGQVPVNAHSRARLRLYGLNDTTVSVRIVGIQSNQELFSTTVTLNGADFDTSFGNVPAIPSYAELALPASYNSADEGVRVEVTSQGDVPIWAFASVTDNVTQEFTIVSPVRLEYLPISLL